MEQNRSEENQPPVTRDQEMEDRPCASEGPVGSGKPRGSHTLNLVAALRMGQAFCSGNLGFDPSSHLGPFPVCTSGCLNQNM